MARVKRTIELEEDRKLIQSTEKDSLTGLYNREYFFRYAEQFDLRNKEIPMDAILVNINPDPGAAPQIRRLCLSSGGGYVFDLLPPR